MDKQTNTMESYLEAAQVFHWATNRHFQLWFTGMFKTRHRRTEVVLKRLSKRGKLRAVRYGKGLIYALPRKTRGFDEINPKVPHGLSCTECLVRFYRSRTDCEVVAERFFYGMGCVPEWGILYPDGKILLLEFSTKSNFLFSGLMRGKLEAYRRHLSRIEEKFKAKAIVIFVLDIPKEMVERFVLAQLQAGSVADGDQSAPYGGDTFPFYPFFFVDYETFLDVPIGRQFTEPIYFWSDGKKYPLVKNV